MTALSCLDMPDLRELARPIDVPGDKTPSSSSGVTERGSENEVTPEWGRADVPLGELWSDSDSKAEPAIDRRVLSSCGEKDDIVGAVTR